MSYSSIELSVYRKAIQEQGYLIFRDVIDTELVGKLRDDTDAVIQENKLRGIHAGNYFYLAHTRAESFLDLFRLSPLQSYIDDTLSDTCIIHSYNGVLLEPSVDNPIQNAIHRDSPRFCRPYLLSMQILYLLDDFTLENGATYLLPGSHLKEGKPSEKEFYENAVQVEAKAGDAVIFDAMLWHAAGFNSTSQPRRGLTVVYTRSFMKQQIDLTRATDEKIVRTLTADQRRLLGFNVRVPASYEEFNVDLEQRLYLPNQG